MSGMTNRIGPGFVVRHSLSSGGICVSTTFVNCFKVVKKALTAKMSGLRLIHFVSSSQPGFKETVKAGELTDFVAVFERENPKKGREALEEAEDQLAEVILNGISGALGEQFKSIELNILPLPTAEDKERIAENGQSTKEGHFDQIDKLVVHIRVESSIKFPDWE